MPLQCTTCKLASLLGSVSYCGPEGRKFESAGRARKCQSASVTYGWGVFAWMDPNPQKCSQSVANLGSSSAHAPALHVVTFTASSSSVAALFGGSRGSASRHREHAPLPGLKAGRKRPANSGGRPGKGHCRKAGPSADLSGYATPQPIDRAIRLPVESVVIYLASIPAPVIR